MNFLGAPEATVLAACAGAFGVWAASKQSTMSRRRTDRATRKRDRATTAAERAAERRVEGEAYDRAAAIYDHTIEQLLEQNQRLAAQVDDLERQLAAALAPRMRRVEGNGNPHHR